MMLNYKLIGRRVRSLRKARELSQAELAEHTGLSVPYISHIENGIKQISLRAIVSIAEALDCSVDQLLHWKLVGSSKAQQSEVSKLLSDCSAAEQHFLWEMLVSMKHCIRNSKQFIHSIDD